MPVTTESVYNYECDLCRQVVSQPGPSMAQPTGWLSLTTGELFCRWRCLRDYAVARIEAESATTEET